MSYDIYCLSFKNPERKAHMESRFKQLEIDCIFSDGVVHNEWSIMLGTLEVMKQFYNSDKEFCIFCEDDIYIHKEFKTRLPKIISWICGKELKHQMRVNLVSTLRMIKIGELTLVVKSL